MDEGIKKDARDLVVQIRRVRIGYTAFLAKALDGMGINIPQYTALAVLGEKGEITMTVLADSLGITMGAVTNIVDRLIEGGWASRERGSDDRRVVRVKITEPGQEVLAKAVAAGTDYVAGWLEGVNPADRKVFVDVYRRVADLMERKGPPSRE